MAGGIVYLRCLEPASAGCKVNEGEVRVHKGIFQSHDGPRLWINVLNITQP